MQYHLILPTQSKLNSLKANARFSPSDFLIIYIRSNTVLAVNKRKVRVLDEGI